MINKLLLDFSYKKDELKRAKHYMNMLSMKVDIKRKWNMKQVKIEITGTNNTKYYGLTHHSDRAWKLVRKHFPRHHKLHKIVNINTLKLSKCCMKNMSNIIRQHNAKVLSTSTIPQERENLKWRGVAEVPSFWKQCPFCWNHLVLVFST